MASTSETGLQLFARLVPRPSLVGLDSVLFDEGPNAKEVVELSGDVSCGKTLLLCQFVVKSILPKEWKEFEIGGSKAGVVLLNTDHHFQMYKLISMLESRLRTVNKSFAVAEVEEIVKEALSRLIVYNVCDSLQLQVTFHALQSVVSNQPEISLILLDSICAFYWQDCMASGIRKMDLYAKTVLKTLQRTLVDFKGVIMYTRPSYFQSKSSKPEQCSSEPTLGCVNKKITLQPLTVDDQNMFCAHVESPSRRFTRMFTIDSTGIQWLEEK